MATPETQNGNLCENFPCPNNMECQILSNRKPVCTCKVTFRGVNCTQGAVHFHLFYSHLYFQTYYIFSLFHNNNVEINPNVLLRFPKYGVSEYILVDFPPGDLKEISVCVWLKTKDTFNYGTIFSYATHTEDNSLTLTDYSG